MYFILQIDIRYNKHGPNEELEKLNKTGLPGIETTLPNSYCNSMLQVIGISITFILCIFYTVWRKKETASKWYFNNFEFEILAFIKTRSRCG